MDTNENRSGWQVSVDPVTKTVQAKFTLTQADREDMHADRIRLIDDASDLIRRAFEAPGEPTPAGELRRAAKT